ncbi:MAG: hypothetical protein IJ849_03725, partial [Selenomonadaceae bacterium]|nr:hypothetical protein [Selenomonadaceae bacterium]
ARGLPPASFRFHLTMDTLALGYILPTTGRIPDLHRLEMCAAGRTQKGTSREFLRGAFLLRGQCNCHKAVIKIKRFLYIALTGWLKKIKM